MVTLFKLGISLIMISRKVNIQLAINGGNHRYLQYFISLKITDRLELCLSQSPYVYMFNCLRISNSQTMLSVMLFISFHHKKIQIKKGLQEKVSQSESISLETTLLGSTVIGSLSSAITSAICSIRDCAFFSTLLKS